MRVIGCPSHTTQKPSKICPPGTHVRQNEVVCDRRALKYGNTCSRAKNTIIQQNCFRSQVHPTQSVPAKRFRSYVHPTQSLQGKRFRSQVHHTQFFPLNHLHYWIYRTRSMEETVWQRLSITHSFHVVNVCARWPNANSFQEKVVCDCSLIQHCLFLETVCVAWGHCPWYFFNNGLE